MLAVLSLAAISRSCNALAIAGPSFSAVARGNPSTGAIATLVLSGNAKIGAPRRGTSSANGCGSGWQPAAGNRKPSGATRRRIWRNGIERTCGLITKRDRRERASVGWLAAQASTAIAEEMLILGNRVVSGTLDSRDTSSGKAVLDIAGQIEHEVAGPQCRNEEGCARSVLRESLREFRPDLVGALGNARPDAGANSSPLCAQPLHAVEGSFDDAGERPAPAAMRGADHPGYHIREQDRGTIGGKNAKGDTGECRDQTVGLRRRLAGPKVFHGDHRGAVDLVAGHQPISRQPQPGHGDRAVPRNGVGGIARSEPAVQRLEQPPAGPATACEEGMTNAGIV